MVKNLNVAQKSKFSSKNRNFGQKSKCCPRIEILIKNRNFDQKSKFWSKSQPLHQEQISYDDSRSNRRENFETFYASELHNRFYFGKVFEHEPNSLWYGWLPTHWQHIESSDCSLSHTKKRKSSRRIFGYLKVKFWLKNKQTNPKTEKFWQNMYSASIRRMFRNDFVLKRNLLMSLYSGVLI